MACHHVYGCQCRDGWQGDTCEEDVDECRVNPNVCGDARMECVNVHGSYYCECQNGYTAYGDECVGTVMRIIKLYLFPVPVRYR